MENYSRQMSPGWEVIEGEDLNEYGLTRIQDDEEHFPVAIIGMSCRMAGIECLADYHKVLTDKLRTYGDVPAERWSKEEWYGGPETKVGFTNSTTAGFIPYLWSFDNTFFNTSPKEALSMDPQQYHVMECVQEALDDAGLTNDKIPRNTAVYMSMKMGEQTLVCSEDKNILNPYILTGGAHTVTANRVNFFYDIRGPSMGVEGSCSASLHGIHFGLWSLWNKECDAVIAGGVNHLLSPHFHMAQSHREMLSKAGEARPFDSSADGRVRAEGAGCVILKPLADALRDGDHVHCVIRASVLGYKSSNLGITMNDADSISNTIGNLYTRFGISPTVVDYIEANGSGVPSEDIMEIEAISKAFREREDSLKIGSCKANVGHSESASGVAQIIKAAMMLENREYLPQSNFDKLHSSSKADGCQVELSSKKESFTKNKNMVVAINSMSFSGQIVHMLLEEFQNPEKNIHHDNFAGWKFGVSDQKAKMIPIVLSAKNKGALTDYARKWKDYENELEDAQVVASWLATKRNHYSHRLVIFANSASDVKAKLNDYIEGTLNDSVVTGTVPPSFHKPKVCFVCPGQGQQWWDMGRSLYASEPLYKDIIDECDRIWKEESGYSFLEKDKTFVEDTTGADPSNIDEIIVSQPAIVGHQIGLAMLMQHWGIHPDMVIGHSLGEVAAAYIAGGMTLEECITSIYHRANTQSQLSGSGKMAAARMTPEQGDQYVKDFDDLFVACYNSTESVTLSGCPVIVEKLAEENPKMLKIIKVKAAFHTKLMCPVRDEFFEKMIGKFKHKLTDGKVEMFSTVFKAEHHGPYDPKYWWQNIENPVFFSQANQVLLEKYGDDVVFVEIGASPTLLSCVRQTAKHMDVNPAGYVSCSARGQDDYIAALKGLAQLYFMGFDINWGNVTRNCARYVELPMYPFQRTEYRLESQLFRERRLGIEDKSYRGRYGQIDMQMHPFLSDYVLNGTAYVPASGLIEYMIETDKTFLRELEIHNIPEFFPEIEVEGFSPLFIDLVENDNTLLLQTGSRWNSDKRQKDTIYASCKTDKRSGNPIATKLDIQLIHTRCPVLLEDSTVYDSLRRKGFEYGQSFRTIKQLNVGDGEALGLLGQEPNRYEKIKTVSLDAAFQVALSAFVQSCSAFTLSRMDMLQMVEESLPLGEDFYVYTKLTNWDVDFFKTDLYITDTVGNVLASGLGCTFEEWKTAVSNISDYMYVLQQDELETDTKNGDILVVCGRDDAKLGQQIQQSMPSVTTTIALQEFFFMNLDKKTELFIVYIWNPKNAYSMLMKRSRSESLFEEMHDLAVHDITKIVATAKKANCKSVSIVIPEGYESSSLITGFIQSLTSNICNVSTIKVMKAESKEMAGQISKALWKDKFFIQVGPKTVNSASYQKLETSRLSNKLKDQVEDQSPIADGFIKVEAKAFTCIGDLLQCSGKVKDTASNSSKFHKGDRIIVISAPSESPSFVCLEAHAIVLDDTLLWKDLSGLCATYGFASHILSDLVHLQQEERIYIADGSTALGEALENLAKYMGATVLTNTMRESDGSRFMKDVEQTDSNINGQLKHENCIDVFISSNTDVIHNKLIDSASDTSRICIINFDKDNDILDYCTERIKDIFFFNAIDLVKRRPEILIKSVQNVHDLMKVGHLRSIAVLNKYQDLPHDIGSPKILNFAAPNQTVEGKDNKNQTIKLKTDATYMIYGHYNGITFEMANWLANMGAIHIALVSPSGRAKMYQHYALDNLQHRGVMLYEIKSEIIKELHVVKVVQELTSMGAPTLRGIFHTTAAAATKAVNPSFMISTKNSKSARALDVATRSLDLPMDYFVILASAAGLAGSILLAESSAISADLAALTEERLGLGLPALALYIGPTYQMDTDTDSLMKDVGFRLLPARVCLEALEILLTAELCPAMVTVTNQDWQQTRRTNPGIASYIDPSLLIGNTDNQQSIERIRESICEQLSKLMCWPRDYFQDHVSLRKYGLEDLIGREFSTWLYSKFQMTLTLKNIADGITLGDLLEQFN